jgi:hypothetical protein
LFDFISSSGGVLSSLFYFRGGRTQLTLE